MQGLLVVAGRQDQVPQQRGVDAVRCRIECGRCVSYQATHGAK
jgi:hypothetical protein